jgi:hypothetical protein
MMEIACVRDDRKIENPGVRRLRGFSVSVEGPETDVGKRKKAEENGLFTSIQP